jgi:hypothetical protein
LNNAHGFGMTLQDSDTTPQKQGLVSPWKPGQSGNPLGRPKGARNRLGEKFLLDLEASWQENGIDVINRVIKDRPHEYLKVVAG